MDQDMNVSNREVLQRFLNLCAELENHAFLASRFIPTLQVVHEAQGARYLLNEPEPLALGDFIPKLRIAMSPREMLYADALRQLLQDVVVDDALRDELARLSEDWKMHESGAILPIVYNGQEVRPKQAWRLLLYGGRLHYDLGKRRCIEDLTASNVLWIYQLKFYHYIDHASNYVLGIGRVAKSAIERDAIDWSRARYRRSKAA